MRNKYHQEILSLITNHSGTPTQHTYLDSYLGNTHPRYPINVPTLRKIAKEWMNDHCDLKHKEFSTLISSLVRGESSTEKCFTGILLDYSTPDQRQFNPKLFVQWLNHIKGWAEVDALCTGIYSVTQITSQWKVWKPILVQLSKSDNINKRRASIVLLCSPLRSTIDNKLATLALENIERLKGEREILITKAISWTLRSMEKHYKKILTRYIQDNKETLPKIAVRETLMKLKTGIKNKKK